VQLGEGPAVVAVDDGLGVTEVAGGPFQRGRD
jgi:hypothetical protein